MSQLLAPISKGSKCPQGTSNGDSTAYLTRVLLSYTDILITMNDRKLDKMRLYIVIVYKVISVDSDPLCCDYNCKIDNDYLY